MGFFLTILKPGLRSVSVKVSDTYVKQRKICTGISNSFDLQSYSAKSYANDLEDLMEMKDSVAA